jgi:hypothetical protein
MVDCPCGLMVRVPRYRSRGPGFDSRHYQIFWEVANLERGPLSLVRIIEDLLELKSSGSGLESEINGRWDSLCWPRDTLYPLKLALTSLTSGGCSVGIVCWRTKVPEFFRLMGWYGFYEIHLLYGLPGSLFPCCWLELWETEPLYIAYITWLRGWSKNCVSSTLSEKQKLRSKWNPSFTVIMKNTVF